MTHTRECGERAAKVKADREAWEKEHPNFCRTCGGMGAFATRGCSVPCGETSVNLPDDIDPCPDCSEKGVCPWCGDTNLDEDNGRCRNVFCRWQWDEAPPSGDAECVCPFDF